MVGFSRESISMFLYKPMSKLQDEVLFQNRSTHTFTTANNARTSTMICSMPVPSRASDRSSDLDCALASQLARRSRYLRLSQLWEGLVEVPASHCGAESTATVGFPSCVSRGGWHTGHGKNLQMWGSRSVLVSLEWFSPLLVLALLLLAAGELSAGGADGSGAVLGASVLLASSNPCFATQSVRNMFSSHCRAPPQIGDERLALQARRVLFSEGL